MTLTTLLFDLGDVLVKNDWNQGFRQLVGHMRTKDGVPMTLEEIATELHPGKAGHIWNDFGLGKVTEEDFWPQVRRAYNYTGDPDLLRRAMTKIQRSMPERQALFRTLTQNKNIVTAIISDTNEAHATYIETSQPELFEFLPKAHVFYSQNIGAHKKDGPAIYRHALEVLKVKAANALMIDDRESNRKGAEEAGIAFLCVQPDEDLGTILREKYGLVF